MKIRTTLLASALGAVALAAGVAGPASAAPSKPALAPGIGTYYVTVHTGNLPDAGTDATVLLTVVGDQGGSPVENLDNDHDNFERGKTDTFGAFNWINIGRANRIYLTKGKNGSAWFPAYVQIHSQSDGYVVTCDVAEWYRNTRASETRTYTCA